MLEDQGLLTKKGKGATGHSGVSSSMELSKCLGYLGDSYEGRIYIIDSSKLDKDDHGYSMKHIVLENGLMNEDKTGGEVNFTYVQNKAIVGWIKVANSVVNAKDEDKTQEILNGFSDGTTIVEFNELYGKQA